MKVGKVVGAIWATRKAACLQGQTFLVVESNGEKIVAADQVGAGTGASCHGDGCQQILHGRPGGRCRRGHRGRKAVVQTS